MCAIGYNIGALVEHGMQKPDVGERCVEHKIQKQPVKYFVCNKSKLEVYL